MLSTIEIAGANGTGDNEEMLQRRSIQYEAI
jgi:hypothetical protein